MLGILILAVFLIYFNTLKTSFHFDDRAHIQNAKALHMTELSFEGLKKAALGGYARRRPVANMTLALNYYFSGESAGGFRFFNILVHITAGIFLYILTLQTLRLTKTLAEEKYRLIAFFTALIWLVHPLQTQSVTYIIQRMNSLAAMFYLMAMVFYVWARQAEEKKRKIGLFAACVISGLLALGSKELSITLPFFIFLYEWYFFQKLDSGWLKKYLPYPAVFLALAVVMSFIYLGPKPWEIILREYSERRDFTLEQRLMTEWRVVVYYLTLILFPSPSRLNLDHDFRISSGLFEPATTLPSLLLLIGLLVLAVYLARREPLISFGLIWFLGNLFLESSFLGLEIIFEHRTYLPSALVIMVLVTLAFRYINPAKVLYGVLLLAAVILGAWTYDRNLVWRDEITLWSDSVSKSPDKPRPYFNLGQAYFNEGEYKTALGLFVKSLSLAKSPKPKPMMYEKIGATLVKLGQYEKALAALQEGLTYAPEHFEIQVELANAYNGLGQKEKALEALEKAAILNPESFDVQNNMGILLVQMGRLNEALDHFKKAVSLNPDSQSARANLARAEKMLDGQ